MNHSNKNNIHKEGMNLGNSPGKSKSTKDEWVEEGFGKEADGVPIKRARNKTSRTDRKAKGK